MSGIIGETITLRVGEKTDLGFNRPVKYTITTTGGTVIKGIVPANERLLVTNGGDIASFDIDIHEISNTPKPL